MSEKGEGLPKTSKTEEEIDLRDDLGTQHREIDKFISKRQKSKLGESQIIQPRLDSETAEKKTTPLKPPSIGDYINHRQD